VHTSNILLYLFMLSYVVRTAGLTATPTFGLLCFEMLFGFTITQASTTVARTKLFSYHHYQLLTN